MKDIEVVTQLKCYQVSYLIFVLLSQKENSYESCKKHCSIVPYRNIFMLMMFLQVTKQLKGRKLLIKLYNLIQKRGVREIWGQIYLAKYRCLLYKLLHFRSLFTLHSLCRQTGSCANSTYPDIDV